MSIWNSIGHLFSEAGQTIVSVGSTVVHGLEDGVQAVRDGVVGDQSKGIDYFVFLSNSPPFTVNVDTRGQPDENVSGSGEHGAHTGIYEHSLNLDEKSGRFTMTVFQNGNSINSQDAEVNPMSGNLDSGSMIDMLKTKSIIGADYSICYGMYDAKPGTSDAAYIYVTPRQTTWMTDLIQSDPALGEKPFAGFVLPGAHDAGMSLVNSSVLQDAKNSPAWNAVTSLMGDAFGSITSLPLRIITNLAVTQKDDISTLLNLGIRYFDFRPGYCLAYCLLDSKGDLFHQHNFITGSPYLDFLTDVLEFLMANQGEIVVVALCLSGFMRPEMKPDAAKLNDCYAEAVKRANAGGVIEKGVKADVQLSYNQLIAANKRIIFLNDRNAPIDIVNQYDSYSDHDYATTDASKIVGFLNDMYRSGQAGKDITILQLQETANFVPDQIVNSVLTQSDASSPLLGAKPYADSLTYPWIQSQVAAQFDPGQLVAFLNDFADNQLVFHSINISKARLQAVAPVVTLEVPVLTPAIGTLWGVGTEHNVGKWDPGLSGWVDTQVGWTILSIAFDAQGSLWGVGTEHNVGKWDGTGFADMGSPRSRLSIAFDAQGSLWGVGTDNSVGKWNPDSKVWDQMDVGWTLLSIAFDSHGDMWGVGTEHNVGKWDGTGFADMGSPWTMLSIACDLQSNLWGVWTNHNVVKLNQATNVWEHQATNWGILDVAFAPASGQ